MATEIYKHDVKYGPNGQKQVYEERLSRYDAPVQQTSRYAGVGFLYFLLDIVEILLAIRLILRLLAANPSNTFVSLMYQITAPLIGPFRGAFAPTVTQGTVIEWSTVLAMVIYALVVYAIVRLVELATRPAVNR